MRMKTRRIGLAAVFLFDFHAGTLHAATAQEIPASVSVVNADEIRRLDAKSLIDVMERLPSVSLNRSGTLGGFGFLRMRGAPSSSQTQVYLDDLPLGGVSSQGVDLSQIPVEDIERIEVVRGGPTAAYGSNTMGGVVHIVTKRHQGPRPVSTVGIESQSFKTQIYRGSLGAQRNGFDGYVNASRYFTDGFQKNADGTGTSISGNGGYTFAGGGRISVSASRYDNDTGDPRGTLLPISRWDGSRERDPVNTAARVEQNWNTGRVQAAFPVGHWGELQTSSFGSDHIYNERPQAGAGAYFHRRTQIVGNDTRLQFPFGLLAGASYERDRQEILGDDARHRVDWGAYLQQTLSLGPFTLVPAARFDQYGDFGNTYNPRLTGVYQASDRLTFSANAARSFRAPSFTELFYAGAGTLRPETAWSYDMGGQWETSEHTSLSVAGFYVRLRDRISDGAFVLRNEPRAEQSGVEVESAGRAGPFIGRINYTYTRAIGNSTASSRYVPLRLTPRHTANVDLTWDLSKKWSLTNRVRYVGKRFQFDEEKGAVLPSFEVWDVRVTRRILAAELYFGVENAANRRYVEGLGNGPSSAFMPQPRRMFVGGINVRFVD